MRNWSLRTLSLLRTGKTCRPRGHNTGEMALTYEDEAHASAHAHACVLQHYLVGLRGDWNLI